mmetsp:Transcript_2316/g.5540  ORF Transcript_2316/g.5540 Transcript_2316/m.5540 type:complete len:231 (-) Transcript_2316:84-776(-)
MLLPNPVTEILLSLASLVSLTSSSLEIHPLVFIVMNRGSSPTHSNIHFSLFIHSLLLARERRALPHNSFPVMGKDMRGRLISSDPIPPLPSLLSLATFSFPVPGKDMRGRLISSDPIRVPPLSLLLSLAIFLCLLSSLLPCAIRWALLISLQLCASFLGFIRFHSRNDSASFAAPAFRSRNKSASIAAPAVCASVLAPSLHALPASSIFVGLWEGVLGREKLLMRSVATQ